MQLKATTVSLCLLCGCANAASFESGNWAASKIGQACHVYSLHADRGTTGALVFTFYDLGYNASFRYEYLPWPGETGAPWDKGDFPILYVDDAEIWLGEEMFPDQGPGGYSASMTGGLVPDMTAALSAAKQSTSIAFDRAAHGEVRLYGRFAAAGFTESLQQAGEWCNFNPGGLPPS